MLLPSYIDCVTRGSPKVCSGKKLHYPLSLLFQKILLPSSIDCLTTTLRYYLIPQQVCKKILHYSPPLLFGKKVLLPYVIDQLTIILGLYSVIRLHFYSRKMLLSLPHDQTTRVLLPSFTKVWFYFGKNTLLFAPLLFGKNITTIFNWSPNRPTSLECRHAKASYASFIWDYGVLLQCFHSTLYSASEKCSPINKYPLFIAPYGRGVSPRCTFLVYLI
jgi:hypothetical protein